MGWMLQVRAVYGGYGLGSCALTLAALYSEVPEAAGWLQVGECKATGPAASAAASL